MKLLFFGDSITDAGRERGKDGAPSSYGYGFVRAIAGKLLSSPRYTILNRGINGNKTVDLYARVKADVWNESPDVLTVLAGINDIAFDIKLNTGVEPARYKKVYRALLEETKERFPAMKIILMEPFMGRGAETHGYYEAFCGVREYAAAVERLAEEFALPFVPLQKDLDALAQRLGAQAVLADGVHPNIAGAELIAEKWLSAFRKLQGINDEDI